jgi:hypothetical protein
LRGTGAASPPQQPTDGDAGDDKDDPDKLHCPSRTPLDVLVDEDRITVGIDDDEMRRTRRALVGLLLP